MNCVDDCKYREMLDDANADLQELKDENAKLRELVKALDWCTENTDLRSRCDECPLEQSDKLTPECEVRMRELRIGVDGWAPLCGRKDWCEEEVAE